MKLVTLDPYGWVGERKFGEAEQDEYWVAGVGGTLNSYLIAFHLLDFFFYYINVVLFLLKRS